MPGRSSSESDRRNPHSLAAAFDARGLSSLAQFSYLQVLDILTTVAFLSGGVEEANPVVRAAMQALASPLLGLLALKMCAFVFAAFCVVSGRTRLLSRVNFFFAGLVLWNVIAIAGK